MQGMQVRKLVHLRLWGLDAGKGVGMTGMLVYW
jgi:hypothetical protein